jgi:glutamyl-tRNA synthetase
MPNKEGSFAVSDTSGVKVRFAPSPTGYLHVGGARTALFNWLYARKTGGKFLLRIEDTDRVRHVEGAAEKVLDDLRWLGIDWDEGYGVGGPAGPYRQSERLEVYRLHAERLLAAGRAYYAFETTEELEDMRKRAQAEKMNLWYKRPERTPVDPVEAQRARAEGKPVVVRFKVPGEDVTVTDVVFGDVHVAASEQEDFIILKDDGYPTYHLANVVDDALMGVTLVMRGQEFLGQTWRQRLLREALGLPEPSYAHLPLILDMQGRKLSKREGDVEVHSFREGGYLPEALVNFIALLGWNPGGDREKMTRDELIESFSLDRLIRANAKFDRDKLLAFNTDAAAQAGDERLLEAFRDYLSLNPGERIPRDNEAVLRTVLNANRGFRTFRDISDKSGVLFGDSGSFEYDDKAVSKVLAGGGGGGYEMLAGLRPELAKSAWEPKALSDLIERACLEKGVGMGKVAQPIRVAVTGRTISPGIIDTLLILGRENALARIDRCLAMRK